MDSDNQISSKPIKLPPQFIGGIDVMPPPLFLVRDEKVVKADTLENSIKTDDSHGSYKEFDEKGHIVMFKN